MSEAPHYPPLPLARFEILHTTDVNEARDVVAEAFCPHTLRPLDRARGFDTRFHAAGTADVSLCYLDYGGRVHIEPDPQKSFHLVLIPKKGKAELRYGRDGAQYRAGEAGIPPPDDRYAIDVGAHSPHTVVRIDRARLEEHLGSMLACGLRGPIRFTMGMAAATVRSWRTEIRRFGTKIASTTPTSPRAIRRAEDLLLSKLLLSQPNTYSADLYAPPRPASLAEVRHAVDLMESPAGWSLSVVEIAKAVGVSIRSLEYAFRRDFDTTPQRYRNQARLRHVREALIKTNPTEASVKAVLADLDVEHNGNFSHEYQVRFGEKPSVTLRRR